MSKRNSLTDGVSPSVKDIEVNTPTPIRTEADIVAKVAELKRKHGIQEVFVLSSGDKIGYLKRPSREQMKYATQVAQGNLLELSEQVLRNGWLDGDRELIDDDFYFYGVTEQVEKILATATTDLKKY